MLKTLEIAYVADFAPSWAASHANTKTAGYGNLQLLITDDHAFSNSPRPNASGKQQQYYVIDVDIDPTLYSTKAQLYTAIYNKVLTMRTSEIQKLEELAMWGLKYTTSHANVFFDQIEDTLLNMIASA